MYRSRLIPALFGYILLILVPITLMIIQGVQSLNQKEEDMYRSSRAELKAEDDHLRYTLEREWNLFLDQEQSRKAQDYFPFSFPSKDLFWTQTNTLAYQRSPLWGTLVRPGSHKGDPSSQEQGLFRASLFGYFELDPITDSISTPYDPQSYFSKTPAGYDAYFDFLKRRVKPELNQFLDLGSYDHKDPISLLLRLKTYRTHKTMEKKNLYQQLFPGEAANSQDELEVSYYAFHFLPFLWQSDHYLIGFRAVLFENQVIRIQGFVIHLFSLLQEIQAYLEPLQPDSGQVVLGFSLQGGVPLFSPFDMMSSTIGVNENSKVLEGFQRDRTRFWQVMITLIVILLVTSFALARMIITETTLNQKKTDFISAITHELKTPLTSIQMYAEMLEEGWAKGKEKVYYHHISCESKRLTRLIANVLNFARLEKGSFVLHKQELEIGQFLDEIVDSWETWLDESGLKIEYAGVEDIWIFVDPDGFKQVFYNLCDNAIKYAHQDGVDTVLFVEVETVDDEVVIRVFDNGPGIPKSERFHIFQRFYRVENESTRETTGTGLGLALVKEIIQECGGQISSFKPIKTDGFGLIFSFPTLDSLDR